MVECLNARIVFKNRMRLTEEKVKQAVVAGVVAVGKQEWPVEMGISKFLELKDMISNLMNERNSQARKE